MGTSHALALFVVGAVTSGTEGFAPTKNRIIMDTGDRRTFIRVSMGSAKGNVSRRALRRVFSHACANKRKFNLLGYGKVVSGCGGVDSLFSPYGVRTRDRPKGNDEFAFQLPYNVQGVRVVLVFTLVLVNYGVPSIMRKDAQGGTSVREASGREASER